MAPGLRARLSAMMFLEFFVWGSWSMVLSDYMTEVGFQGHIAAIYGLFGLASIFMPMIAGQITDRVIATQKFLGAAHLAGAVGVLVAAFTKDYTIFFAGMLIWNLAYAPTISLTNSLAFSHMKDPEKDFGSIRLFGTLGWIAALLLLTAWRWAGERFGALKIGGNDCMFLSGAAGILMGFFCFKLPDTPPARSGVSPFAFLRAFALLKNPRMAIFLLVAFVGGMILQFYFTQGGVFLRAIGTQQKNLPLVTGIGQAFEILSMLALPLFLKRLGPRMVLFLGMIAFALRNLVFAIGAPYELVAGSIALHGMSFVFFFVVSFIYIDMAAPKDIKASAQGLLTLVVFGFGNWLGNMLVGEVLTWCTAPEGTVNWSKFFLVPMVMSIVCAVVFMLTFPKGSMKEASGTPLAEPAAAESR